MRLKVDFFISIAEDTHGPKVAEALRTRLQGIEFVDDDVAIAMLNDEHLKSQTPQPSPALVPITSGTIVEEGFTPEMEHTLLGLKGSNL